MAIVKVKKVHDPADLISAGKILKEHIRANGLSTKIAGKDYPHVTAFVFVATMFGYVTHIKKPVAMHKPGEMMRIVINDATFQGQNGPYAKEVVSYCGLMADDEGYSVATTNENGTKKPIKREIIKPFYSYECECTVINGKDKDKVIGFGYGICSNLELSKSKWDEYAILSMSQTRCQGKGLKNQLGFLMSMNGLEGTAAEEVTEDHQHQDMKTAQKAKGKTPEKADLTEENLKSVLTNIKLGKVPSLEAVEAAMNVSPDQRTQIEAAFKEMEPIYVAPVEEKKAPESEDLK